MSCSQESKAGLAVGKLRSHASKQVSDLAKEIVKKWKQHVEQEKQHNAGSRASAAGNVSAAVKPAGNMQPNLCLKA